MMQAMSVTSDEQHNLIEVWKLQIAHSRFFIRLYLIFREIHEEKTKMGSCKMEVQRANLRISHTLW